MPPILRVLLPFVLIFIVILIGFQIHWMVGVVLIVAILGYSLYSSRAVIYAQRGNLAFMKGDEAKALELLEKAHRTGKGNPQHMVGYAYLLLKTGKYAEAEQLLKDILAKKPADLVRLQANINLATVYWLTDRKSEGLELLEEMQQEFKNTKLYGNLGYYKILQGDDLEGALAFNLEAYEYNSDDLTILDNLAQNYYYLGRLEEAAEMYEKVMAKQPRNADSYYFYAMTLEKLGRLEEAKEQIAKAKERELALVTPLKREDIEQKAKEFGI